MPGERWHEIKDPIHGFIRLQGAERSLLDHWPVQRLRHIHQLSLTMQVYPGATHRRFEHSLGVMHLSGLAFDAVNGNAGRFEGALALPDSLDPAYWRRVVRMAALLHDLGHLPFSHAAEDLLPSGLSHEHLSEALILGVMAPHLEAMHLRPQDVARVAVGGGQGWEATFSSLITGDAFGADRIDYLLRDAYHSGAQAGGFDAARLVSRLVLLPGKTGPVVGLEAGALQAAEALLTTRDFLYEGLYFHPVRRVLDHHLGQFLREALGTALLPDADRGCFSPEPEIHLRLTDDEVFAALRRADHDPLLPGHRWARRIVHREHYRLLYRARQATDAGLARRVYQAASARFGAENVLFDPVSRRPGRLDFLLLERGSPLAARQRSRLLRSESAVQAEYVFVEPSLKPQARAWLREAMPTLL